MKDWVQRVARCEFWSRCEYEHVIGPWPWRNNNLEEQVIKIDVYQQIMMNIDIIVEILYNELVKKTK